MSLVHGLFKTPHETISLRIHSCYMYCEAGLENRLNRCSCRRIWPGNIKHSIVGAFLSCKLLQITLPLMLAHQSQSSRDHSGRTRVVTWVTASSTAQAMIKGSLQSFMKKWKVPVPVPCHVFCCILSFNLSAVFSIACLSSGYLACVSIPVGKTLVQTSVSSWVYQFFTETTSPKPNVSKVKGYNFMPFPYRQAVGATT